MACNFKARGCPWVSDFLSCKSPRAGVEGWQTEKRERREVMNSGLRRPTFYLLGKPVKTAVPPEPHRRLCRDLPPSSKILNLETWAWKRTWSNHFSRNKCIGSFQTKSHGSEGFLAFPAILSFHLALCRRTSLKAPSPYLKGWV